LRNRGVTQEIDVNWHLVFFKRHSEVRLKLFRPIDKQKMFAENLNTFIDWFQRFHETRIKWAIIDPDIYIIDESGNAIGIEQKLNVILSNEKKEAFAKQDENREWATMIECIRVINGDIPPFLIIKGKYILKDFAELIRQSRVTLVYSDNGWSNDVLGLEWLKHFNK